MEKEYWWPKGKIYCCRPWEKTYHWGLKEDSEEEISKDPKENHIFEKPKEDPITAKQPIYENA